jgi:DNA-directed RNA polymerase subunit M/transcription elongation factor TFIIS
MESLLDIPISVRIEWINLISSLASTKIKFNYCFARSIENSAYINRQTKKVIMDNVTVYRYGNIDVLDLDSFETHQNASITHYTKILRRVCWALHGSNYMSQNPDDWLKVSDDILVKDTEHEQWETNFYAEQDLARKVLYGKTSNPSKGIFACTKCKSFDVDTEQKQTRSADEPMTIFCTCNVCGQRFVR